MDCRACGKRLNFTKRTRNYPAKNAKEANMHVGCYVNRTRELARKYEDTKDIHLGTLDRLASLSDCINCSALISGKVASTAWHCRCGEKGVKCGCPLRRRAIRIYTRDRIPEHAEDSRCCICEYNEPLMDSIYPLVLVSRTLKEGLFAHRHCFLYVTSIQFLINHDHAGTYGELGYHKELLKRILPRNDIVLGSYSHLFRIPPPPHIGCKWMELYNRS
jgi:hypothetical protein